MSKVMLTAKQQQTYKFIQQYYLQYGIAPTEAEIAKGIGITSRGVVHRYVTALKELNLLELTANRRRNIRLITEPDSHPFSLPLIGEIAAGNLLKPLKGIAINLILPIRYLAVIGSYYKLKVIL